MLVLGYHPPIAASVSVTVKLLPLELKGTCTVVDWPSGSEKLAGDTPVDDDVVALKLKACPVPCGSVCFVIFT